MDDYSEPQETKEVASQETRSEGISENTKASIQGIEPNHIKEQGSDPRVDFSQEYVDDRTKYIDELIAHKQNVIEHEEDWKKKGLSVSNELEFTDEEIKNTSRLIYEELKNKAKNSKT